MKINLTIILLFYFLSSYGQHRTTDYNSANFRDFANKPYFFGLALGYNNNNFKTFRSGYFLKSDSIASVNSPHGQGFHVGVVTNLKIGDQIDFRLVPTFVFTEKQLEFKSKDIPSKLVLRKAESVLVEIPFQIRYKTAPYKDMRAYLMGGVKYSIDVSNRNRTVALNRMAKIAATDFSIEIGGGFQFYMPFFIFSPELKFSHGVNNILIQHNLSETSKVIDRLFSRTWMLSFNFEG